MEYLIGSLVTAFCFVILSSIVRKDPPVKYTIRHTQSNTHSLIAPFIPVTYFDESPTVTQARKHRQATQVRIVFFENKAYWIANNGFVEADVVGGEIQEETQRSVDIMSMDKIELDKMMFIVEKLTEGQINDSGSAGN